MKKFVLILMISVCISFSYADTDYYEMKWNIVVSGSDSSEYKETVDQLDNFLNYSKIDHKILNEKQITDFNKDELYIFFGLFNDFKTITKYDFPLEKRDGKYFLDNKKISGKEIGLFLKHPQKKNIWLLIADSYELLNQLTSNVDDDFDCTIYRNELDFSKGKYKDGKIIFIKINKGLPDVFKDYIDKFTEKVEYKEVYPAYLNLEPKKKVTTEDLIKDADNFRYLIDTVYSGKTKFENEGYDFDGFFENLEKYINEKKITDIEKFEKFIVENFPDVNDSHLSMYGKHFSKQFSKLFNVYFSDVVLRKVNDRYFVIFSNQKGVKRGMEYTGDKKHLFRTLSKKGEKDFLLGVLSIDRVTEMEFDFNNKAFSLFLHSSRIDSIKDRDFHVRMRDVFNIPIIEISDFVADDMNEYRSLMRFADSGNKYSSSADIIFNVINNYGGSTEYSERFFKSFNKTHNYNINIAKTTSPAIFQYTANTPEKYIYNEQQRQNIENTKKMLDSIKNKPEKSYNIFEKEQVKSGSYKGNCYVISNKNTASAGEDLIEEARYMKNFKLVGSNSMGCFNFGEVLYFRLKNTGFNLSIPSAAYIADHLNEGYGYMPDFWIDSYEPVKELIRYIKFNEDYVFVPRRYDFKDDLFKGSLGIAFEGSEDHPEIKFDDNTKEGHIICVLSGKEDTKRWVFTRRKIPSDVRYLKVEFSVKTENYKKPENTEHLCYAGFRYFDKDNKKQYKTVKIKPSKEWKKYSLDINIAEDYFKDVSFDFLSNNRGNIYLRFDSVKNR